MKLSEWARRNGVHYATAHRNFQKGLLPVKAVQWPSGAIMVVEDEPVAVAAGGTALYARVSGSDQKDDLNRQIARLAAYAASKGLVVTEIVSEIGSGMNGSRPKLLNVLANPQVSTIVVEHADRLSRFGVSFLEAALAASGRTVIVMEKDEISDDLVKDMIEVMTSFCARLYGRRSARNRATKAMAAAAEATGVRG